MPRLVMVVRRPFATLALAALMLLPTLLPFGAADGGAVEVLTQEDGRLVVATANYTADLRWIPSDATLPTDVPVWGSLALADGQRVAYEEHVRLLANGIADRYLRAAGLDQSQLPSAYLVRLASASVTETEAGAVRLRLDFSWIGLPDENGNLSGFTEFTFHEGRIDHGYGYRFPSATAPAVRVTERFAFERPYAEHVSIDPLGIAARDNGESLDRFSTWQSYAIYGMLFRSPDESATGFNLHRLTSSPYTNYLDDGRMRGDADGVSFVTHFNAFDATPAASRSGVDVLDGWMLPPATMTPREIARFWTEYVGGSLGELPPMPPALDSTPFDLRCPDFPSKPDGSPCERVVIAVVDTGVNPYHAWFRRTGWTAHPSTYVDGFPADAPTLDLTFSIDLAYNRLVDLEKFGEVGRERLVTIPGTNIIGAISFGEYTAGHSVPIVDEVNHGTGTASAVTLANPDVALVIVEIGFEGLDRALAWLANQTWIDGVSMSLGTLGDVGPVGRAADAARASPQLATRRMHENGQLVFVASGNNAGATQATDNYDGPEWIISVGGVSGDSRGWWAQSTRGMDVSADPLLTLAAHDNTMGTTPLLGTSFATPTVAGLVSRAILDARVATGHQGGMREGAYVLADPAASGPLADGRLTKGEIRAAMNATAVWFTPQDYRRPPTTSMRDEAPFPPVAPWSVSGWGYLGAAQVAPLTDVLLGNAPAPQKPMDAHAFMEAQYAARATLWTDTYAAWGPHMEQPIVDRP